MNDGDDLKDRAPREEQREEAHVLVPQYNWSARTGGNPAAGRAAASNSLLTEVLRAGANYIHGVDFRTTQLRKHRDDARRQAIQAAREKAADMASALDVSIGAPTNVHEVHSGWWSPYSSWWGGRGGGMMYQNVMQDRRGAGGTEESLVPGQISVTATVSVTFELGSAGQ